MVKCIAKWQENSQFKEAIIQEYLNERSHYRQTGRCQIYFLDENKNLKTLLICFR